MGIKQVSVANGHVNDYNWGGTPPGSNTETLETTDMQTAATFSFTTANAVSTAIGNISAAEASGGGLDREMRVSLDREGAAVLANGTRVAGAPTLPFTVGYPIAGILALVPNVQYFVHIKNLQTSGGNLNLRTNIKKPGSPMPI
jgi:hypothetical protein